MVGIDLESCRVTHVHKGCAADRGGLTQGVVILRVNGVNVKDREGVIGAIRDAPETFTVAYRVPAEQLPPARSVPRNSMLAVRVQEKIRRMVLSDYADCVAVPGSLLSGDELQGVIPEYITVMVCNMRTMGYVERALYEFLQSDTPRFVHWLWDFLHSIRHEPDGGVVHSLPSGQPTTSTRMPYLLPDDWHGWGNGSFLSGGGTGHDNDNQ